MRSYCCGVLITSMYTAVTWVGRDFVEDFSLPSLTGLSM